MQGQLKRASEDCDRISQRVPGPSQHLRQIRTDQVTAVVQSAIALRAVAVELLLPLHHVGFATVFLNQSVDVIATLARAFSAGLNARGLIASRVIVPRPVKPCSGGAAAALAQPCCQSF